MQQHYLLGEVAKILGRRPHQIAYLLTTGQVPEPERRIANKRLFSNENIERLARRLKVRADWSIIERDAGVGEPNPFESLTLKPPFGVFQSGSTGHEVQDGAGEVVCWTSDRAKALIVAGLLESLVQD